MEKQQEVAARIPIEARNFYYEDEMAMLLNKKPSTLIKDRCIRSNHPPFKRLNGTIVYPKREFDKWYELQPTKYEAPMGRTDIRPKKKNAKASANN